MLIILLAVTLGLFALFALSLKLKKKKKVKKETPQLTRPESIASQNVGRILEGVRVVELAEVVAAPLCGRILTDFGAEVIKVEGPKGDSFRKVLLEYEQMDGPRTFSTAFEVLNLGKASLQLDLKKQEDKESLLKLLESADVFITNIRIDCLRRLGLDYDDLHERFPHLVYAHLSAYGRRGPDAGLPGYDVGAFWAASGMASYIQPAGHAHMYPSAFGDVTSGSGLAAGVAAALVKRHKTGSGGIVDTSLLRMGLWCMSGVLATTEKQKEDIVEALEIGEDSDTYTYYNCRDGAVAVLGLETESRVSTYKTVTRASLEAVMGGDDLKGRFLSLTTQEAHAKLDAAGIPNMIEGELTTLRPELVMPCPPGFDDIKTGMVRPPFECSTCHTPICGAAEIGVHTKDVLERGFLSKPIWPSVPKDASNTALPLDGITIVELSHGLGVAAAATSQFLQALGAKIVKVVPEAGDEWQLRDKRIFAQFNYGKELVTADYSAVHSVMASHNASVLVTNAPPSVLAASQADQASLEKALGREIVYSLITPWGKDGSEFNRSDLASYWGYSGISRFMTAKFSADTPVRPQPFMLGELITSVNSAAATAIAIFKVTRTGNGEMIDTSMARSGTWSSLVGYTWIAKDPTKALMFDAPAEIQKLRSPIATFCSFQAKEGATFQLLGLDIGRFFFPTMKGFKVSTIPFFAGLIRVVVTKVLPNKNAPSKIMKLMPAFEYVNRVWGNAAGKKGFYKLSKDLTDAGVWFVVVKSPGQALAYEQAHVTGAFATVDGRLTVLCPTQVTS